MSFRQEAEDLPPPRDLFHYDPRWGQRPIGGLLGRGQRVVWGTLLRRATVGVELADPLVTAVGQVLQVRRQTDAARTEEGEVLLASGTESGGEDLTALLVGDHLALLGRALLLAAVEAALSFFGRSTGLSLAAKTTTVNVVSG